jgi:competence protein ComEC
VAVLGLALGATGSTAPAASLMTAGLGLGALLPRIGWKALLVAALCVAVGWARASWVLAEHASRHAAAVELMSSPSRCAASGIVTSSPAQIGGRLRFDAALTALDCGGRLDGRVWPARLYLPSPPSAGPPNPAAAPLTRGDALSIVADLAPISELRNFELADPRPGAARQRVVLSGGALSLEVEGRGLGVPAWLDRARSHVRARILATFSEPVTGMARALVLGENDLAPGDEQAFQRSGLSHLLAVSGTHLILAVLALVRGLEALLRRWTWLAGRGDVRRAAALLGFCLGPLYADFAGGSGSAWRAAYMLCAVLGVRALGRHVLPSRVIAASLGVGWLGDGLVVFDTSFLLSIAATTGLVAMGRRLDESVLTQAALLTEPRTPELGRLGRAISRAALTTLAATLPCVPILLSMSAGLSLASVAANLLAAPLGEAVALPLCLAHALCSPVPALERGVALVASGALALIRGVAWASASVEWLYFELPPPTEWQIGCLVTGVMTGVSASGRRWLSAVTSSPGPKHPPPSPVLSPSTLTWGAALASVALLLSIEAVTRWQHSAAYGQAHRRLRVTALDVGQGDATLVDLPDGRLMLIDGGGFVGVPIDPGERVILPTLRARRRDRIDVVVLTHPHPDHYGGLLSVMSQVEVGELWYGGPDAALEAAAESPSAPPAPPASAYRRLLELARERGVMMKSARDLCAGPAEVLANARHAAHAGHPVGAATPTAISVLHPCPGVSDEHEANDNSLVLRVRHGQRAALLAGDAERWAEERLLATHADGLAADFLKVAHHGSKTSSSPEFLARVGPRFASISCGIRNRFGHPHAEVLASLDRAGARTLRLDRLGAVQWQTDGSTATVRTFVDGELPEQGGAR